MKNTNSQKQIAPPTNAEAATVSRYQIYRQTRTGTYTVELKTDSAAVAVEAFVVSEIAAVGARGASAERCAAFG